MNQDLPLSNGYPETFEDKASVVPVKDWIVALLISCIPIVNIVMWFIWAFGGNANPNKQNFFKAYLLIALIALIVYAVILGIIIFTLGKVGFDSGLFDHI